MGAISKYSAIPEEELVSFMAFGRHIFAA